MSRRTIVIPCRGPYVRHWWQWVPGLHSTPLNPYIERRCKRCRYYEGDVW